MIDAHQLRNREVLDPGSRIDQDIVVQEKGGGAQLIGAAVAAVGPSLPADTADGRIIRQRAADRSTDTATATEYLQAHDRIRSLSRESGA